MKKKEKAYFRRIKITPKKKRSYPKEYEDVYKTRDIFKRLKPSLLSNKIGWNNDKYIEIFRQTFREFEVNLFNNLVKIYWLLRNFDYRKTRKKGRRDTFKYLNSYWTGNRESIFLMEYLNTDRVSFKGRTNYKIVSYFEELFPDFENRNPFKERMEYPFEFITLSYLVLVYQMDERMDLLNYAEDNKIGYSKFFNYVINYIYVANDRAKRKIFSVGFATHGYFPYIIVERKRRNFERVNKFLNLGQNEQEKIKTSNF